MTSAAPEPLLPDPAKQRTPRLAWPDRRYIVVAARLGWLVVAALSMTLFLIELPTVYSRLLALDQYHLSKHNQALANLAHLGISVNAYAAYMLALALTFALACFAVGMVIGLRRSNEPMALFVAALLVTLGAASIDSVAVLGRTAIVGSPSGLQYWLNFLVNWFSFETVVLLLLLFPDFRFRPRWSRWLAPLTLFWFVRVPDSWWSIFNLSLVATVLAISASAQNYRYHHISDDVQRRQTRLVAVGFAIAGCGFIVDRLCVFFSIFHPGTLAYMIESAVTTACLLCIPASFGIAILRYHLWDIDLIINRTLVYVPLTGLLTGLYSGLVSLIQHLFPQFTGASSFGAGLVATVAVATALTPVKNGLQTVVDRHFKVPHHQAPAATTGPVVAGAAAGNPQLQDPRFEELHGEIAALRAELASRAAAEQEVRELREQLARLELRLSSASG
ncbi:MAG TPA: hypothetical protein VFI42_20300, partial [Thermomicrobiaceae bacterium]|nr:hypothetical protein [Thermomicrobiaceae bacterium]